MIRILGGIIIIVGFLFSCSQNSKPAYRLHIIFDDVSRLKVGDSVFYNAKSIGVISRISFSGSNQDSVDVVVVINPSIPAIPKPSAFTIQAAKVPRKRQLTLSVLRKNGSETYDNRETIRGIEYSEDR